MWIMTTLGFFSVVRNSRDDDWRTLLVRARSRRDLENFIAAAQQINDAEDLGTDKLEIIDTPNADYPHRVVCPRSIFSELMKRQIGELDYTNFKDAVEERRGKPHAKAFMKVWGALHDLEEPGARRGARQLTMRR